MSRVTPLSGFPELLPSQRVVELAVIDQLRSTFELHGFASIETRAAEPLDQLLRKGEIDKEVYVLRRLQAGDDPGDTGLGLHYDLTVPATCSSTPASSTSRSGDSRYRRRGGVSGPRKGAIGSSPKPISTSSDAITWLFIMMLRSPE